MFLYLTKVDKSAETRRNLHTHTHTHTCNPLKAIKQIGTICFAVFTFIFSSFADPDIASSASSADCKYNPLETYTGTSNLQAGWEANTIQLHWYNGDDELTVASASQSCVYDGTLTPPTTIPTKTGYTFKGWRVKQAAGCSFASSVCSLTGSGVNGLTYNDEDSTTYGYYSHDGQNKENESTYGLTAGGWAVKDTSGGIIKGIASCNSTKPNLWDTVMAGMSNGTMTEEQAMNTLWGTCNTDTFRPSNTFSSSSSGGQYCWCKISSYKPSGGNVCNVASLSWVFVVGGESASGCANGCAGDCADLVMVDPVFRRAVFGVSQ